MVFDDDRTASEAEEARTAPTTTLAMPGRGGAGLRQRTLKNAIACTGIGLHSGRKVGMTLTPAAPDTGIVFRRVDLAGGGRDLRADWRNVKDASLCTVIGDDSGLTVGTTEHLLAALSAMGIDNVRVDIDGPEVPAMDGSAAPFVFLIECAGSVDQPAARRAYRVVRPVAVTQGQAMAALTPAGGFTVDFEIEFTAEAIGRQSCSFAVTPVSFKGEVMRARTFGLIDDLPKMREMGLGQGGSLDNAVVVNGAEILNEDGLRYPNEFVRHKALDAIGDMALAGRPMIGRYTGRRASHALNALLLRKAFAEKAMVEVEMTAADLVPTSATPALRAAG
jgi:UDP-3-O-[3-hydroxymyristoyl] N-acetylglucosamine deacetylase